MKKINLDSKSYTEQFVSAPIYARKDVVHAVWVTDFGLKTEAYKKRDVVYDATSGSYVVMNYVTCSVPDENGEDCKLITKLENVQPVKVGDWVVTDATMCEACHDHNHVLSDEDFRKKYEPTAIPGIYRAKGMARIIKNDTGDAVIVRAPRGEQQEGDAECYFLAPYDPYEPTNLALGKRCVLSKEDFYNLYDLASAVFGPYWEEEARARKE